MKTLLLRVGLLLMLTNCTPTQPEPADPLTQIAWCNGYMTYRFDSSGSFTMKSNTSEQVWGGNWSYVPDRTQIDINLHYGHNIRIQQIRLTNIQYTKADLRANWTDEIAQAIPFESSPCTNR